MKKKLLALLFGCVFALLLVEGGARLLERFALKPAERAALVLPYHEIPYQPHPYLNWENQPSRTCRDGERHNALGFRGLERPVTKPQGAFRVACLGGSTTYTQRVREPATYPAQLEVFLKQKLAGRTIEVLNAGVKGYTSAESLQNLLFKVLDYEPDAIVVYHAVNDFYPRTYPGFRPDYLHCRTVWVGTDIEKNAWLGLLESSAVFRFTRLRTTDYAQRGGLYYWIYDPHRDRTSLDAGLADTTTAAFEANLRAICRIAGARGIACVIASQAQNLVSDFTPKPNPAPIDQMNAAARRVATEEGAFFVDAAQGFPQTEGLFDKNDVVHMQADGAKELARRIGQGMLDQKLLERGATAPAIARDEPGSIELVSGLDSPLPAESRARIERGEIVKPSPYFLYALAPNAPASPGLGPHDASGRRVTAPRAADASELPRTVLCLGGAATYGLGVTAEESWPARLQASLRERGMTRFVVQNCGVPGYTSAEMLGAAHFRDLSLAPEVVVIGPGFEDALPRMLPGYRADYAHARGTFRFGDFEFPRSLVESPLPEADDPLGSGAPRRALRRNDGIPGVDPAGPYALYRNLRSLVDLCRGRPQPARVLLPTLVAPPSSPPLVQFAADWNRVVTAIASETGAEIVTLASDVSDFIPGTCAFTPAAHARIAEAVAAALIAPR
jgi:lysophospholipase L1-like esterase